ncbi:MAG TPA: hypothetical protein VG964_04030 [Candidatus Saccharimonadales bacterium]|nr:hypothetical protein [Candidatus Saccharimonadales bacterium]
MLNENHALAIVGRQQYEDEAITRISTEELAIASKYNVRIEFENTSERKYAADFLSFLGNVAVKQGKRVISLGFIGLEGKPLGITLPYQIDDTGLLYVAHQKASVGYLLGANRAIDGFLKSVLDMADAGMTPADFEENRQLQLV